MAGSKDAEGFEEFDVNKLCDWLRSKKASEDIIIVVADNEIDGRTFLDLNGEDLKDLSNSFKVRKEIRRILEQLNEDESDACNTPPPFRKRKRSPSPSPNDLPVLHRPVKKPASFNTKQLLDASECFVPKSEILENSSQYSQQSIETERRRVVRLAMDNLIGQNGGRPSESEVQNLARMMASQYPCLRDRSLESLRDNFNSLVGFTKGRKKGYAKSKEKDNEDHNDNIKSTVDQENPAERREPAEKSEEAVKEKEVTVAREKTKEKTDTRETEKIVEKKYQENSEEKNMVQGECISKEQEKTENDDQNTPADKATESLVAALKKSTRPCTSEQLIRLTVAERLKEVEKIPTKERLKYTLNTYKVFNHPESVIFNMYMQVPVELHEMKQKLEHLMTTSLDMLFEKNILKIPRSAIKTTDQKYFVALFHLPNLCGNKSAGKLKPGHHLVHVVKSSEMWSEVAQNHKGTSGPWILHNTIGSNTIP